MGFKMVVLKLRQGLAKLFTTGADMSEMRASDKHCESVLPLDDAMSKEVIEETSHYPQPKNAIQYTTRKVELTGRYIEKAVEQLRAQQASRKV